MKLPKVVCSMLFVMLALPSLAREMVVTAQQVNGTWNSRFGEFQVWALGQQRLQVAFNGIYEYRMSDGSPMANMGRANGIALIKGDTATFKPQSDADCELVMRFVSNTLRVSTRGSYLACGFGHNVTADGVYQKTNSKNPKFEKSDL